MTSKWARIEASIEDQHTTLTDSEEHEECAVCAWPAPDCTCDLDYDAWRDDDLVAW